MYLRVHSKCTISRSIFIYSDPVFPFSNCHYKWELNSFKHIKCKNTLHNFNLECLMVFNKTVRKHHKNDRVHFFCELLSFWSISFSWNSYSSSLHFIKRLIMHEFRFVEFTMLSNAWLYIHTWCCYSHLNFTLGILFSVEIWNPYGFECIQYCVQFQRLCPESPINDALTIINYDNMAYNIHFTHTPVLIFCFREPKWTDLFSVCFFFTSFLFGNSRSARFGIL